jgi:hypothetical protein
MMLPHKRLHARSPLSAVATPRRCLVAHYLCLSLSLSLGGAALDDVGFMRAIVDDVARRRTVDLTRIYATGMSADACIQVQSCIHLHTHTLKHLHTEMSARMGVARMHRYMITPRKQAPGCCRLPRSDRLRAGGCVPQARAMAGTCLTG